MASSTFAQDAQRFGLDADVLHKLATAAIEAKTGAYCPYSQFRVGSALLTHDGHIVTGANVENAAYPVGTCAERCAAAKAVADGHRSFKAIVVSTDVASPAWPCGMCRQFLREFCSLEAPLFSFGEQTLEKAHDWKKGPLPLDAPKYAVMTMRELLPESFGPEMISAFGKPS